MVTGADRHGHGPASGVSGPGARWLSAALVLILAFMAGEIVAGLAAHSLALISDAAHMLTDAASIALVLVTARLAARPPAGGYTYGLRRTEIMSAQANGLTLVLLAAWLGYSAVRRLVTPPPTSGGTVLGVALAGVAVNLAATLLIARAGAGHGDHGAHHVSQPSLNLTGAFKHILTDLYAFAATAVAGLVIVLTGFTRADAIATLVVVVLMLHAGAGLIKQSGRIFLEAAPAGLDPAAVGGAMAARRHVTEVHDLHIWEITSGLPAASAHILVAAGEDCHAVRADLEAFLAGQYGITHATLQVDHAARAGYAPGRERPAEPHCDDAHGPAYRPADR
ncbi:MAG: cation diffusion facilitator family transporter [Streptosporangiaceae bacterium]